MMERWIDLSRENGRDLERELGGVKSIVRNVEMQKIT